MKKVIIKSGLFAKADAQAKPWKERLAKLKAKFGGDKRPTAKLEIDGANGEKIIFPEIGDISEVQDGIAVEAENGKHVFTVDSSVYTIEVLDGKVTSVIEDTTGGDDSEMSAETEEFLTAVAEALQDAAEFKATALARIEALTTELKDFKALMGHKGDGATGATGGAGATGAAGATGGAGAKKPLVIGGKTINLDKINLK